MSSLRPRRWLSFVTPGRRAFIATCVTAGAFLVAPASHGQAGQAPGASSPPNAQQNSDVVNPATVSCEALKARLENAGELRILSGPRGSWADTFYGPKAPRCQFYQMPVFTYVRTNDRLCGVGYICVDKLSFD